MLTKLVKSLYKNNLSRKKNVVGIGTGLKVKGGKITKEECLIVAVSKKEDVDKHDLIPKTLLGAKTDVLEVGELEYSWRKKHDPLKIGASCCWVGLTRCSAGLPVYDKEGNPYLIMNKHCCLPTAGPAKVGDDVVNPGPVDGKPVRIGENTEYYFPESADRKDNIDYMLVKLDKEMAHEDVVGNTYIEEIHSPKQLEKITKGSATIQKVRTSSPILSNDFEATVRNRWDNKIYTYKDTVLTLNTDENGNSIVEGGCSSSIGFINNRPSVQTFAGSTLVGVFNKIENTLEDIYFRFDLELFLTPPEKGWMALGSWTKFDRNDIIVKANSRLREEPGLDAKQIGTIKKGSSVSVINESNIILKDNYYWVNIN